MIKNNFSYKNYLAILLQGLGAMLAFVIGLMVCQPVDAALPCDYGFLGSRPADLSPLPWRFYSTPAANALILVWAARRSSFKGLAMAGQLFVLSFGAQVFQTQIETGYFVSAFPQLHNNFEVYNLILRGFITSLLFLPFGRLDNRRVLETAAPANRIHHHHRHCRQALKSTPSIHPLVDLLPSPAALWLTQQRME